MITHPGLIARLAMIGSLILTAAVPTAWAGERVTNGSFSSGPAGWTHWTERGTVTRDFSSPNAPIGGSSPCLQMSSSDMNGGVYQAISVVPGFEYDVTVVTRDVASPANAAWCEVLIGTSAPVNGSDYGNGCAAISCTGSGCTPAGTRRLKKWDTWSNNDWNGTAPQINNCGSFIANANTMYLVLKVGGNVSVSFDNVSVQGPDPCVAPAAPGAPVLTAATQSTMNVANHASDPADLYYAFRCVGAGYGPRFVQANGSLGMNAVWQTRSAWGTKTVTGLVPGMVFTFDVQASTVANGSCTSAFGPTTSAYTLTRPLCSDNRVANPDFGSSAQWSQWTQRGGANVNWNDTTAPPDGTGGGPCVRVTSTGNFNGGIWTQIELVAGQFYTIRIKTRDANSPANWCWAEALVGTAVPQDGLDYSASTPGTTLLLKWDTWVCNNWNGDETSTCVGTRIINFTATAGTMYLVLKSGENPGGLSDVTWDKVEICGPAPSPPPTAVCQDVTRPLSGGSATVSASEIDGGSTPGGTCTITGRKIKKSGGGAFADSVTFNCLELGPQDVVFQVTQSDGKTAECTAVVSLEDVADPSVVCRATTLALDAAGHATLAAASITQSESDDCGITQRSLSRTDFTCADLGAQQVTLTVKDAGNNTASCEATVEVVDMIPPTITAPSDVMVSADQGACTAAGVALGTPSTSDNCAVSSVTSNAPAEFQKGDTQVTWTVLDSSGNSATAIQTVTVIDEEPPVVACPSDVVVGTDAGSCAAAGVDLGTPTPGDNCGVASVNNNAPASFPKGTTAVTWTVTDSSGNTGTCTQQVTVNDTVAPVITLEPSASEVHIQCQDSGWTPPIPTVVDNCDSGLSAVVGGDTVDPNQLGVYVMTYDAQDLAGNPATRVTLTVYVEQAAPQISPVPQPLTVECQGNSGTPATYQPIADFLSTPQVIDGCDTDAQLSHNAPAHFPLGVTTVTWTATDPDYSGAPITVQQTVTVQDTTAPAITCPVDPAPVPAGANGMGVIPDLTAQAQAADTCCVDAPVVTQDPPAGQEVGIGDHIVTLTATDCSGLIANCTVTVSVVDATAPDITACAVPQTAVAAGACEATVPNFAAGVTASDNCTAAAQLMITQEPAAGTVVGLGITPVIIRVRDAANNEATCNTSFTVGDNTPPEITTCPPPQTASPVSGCQAAVPDFTAALVASDDCDSPAGLTVSQSPVQGTLVGLGVTPVVLTVADSAGNATTCNANFSVTDTTPPTIHSVTASQAGGSVLCPAEARKGLVDIHVTATDMGCSGVQQPTVSVDGIGPATYVDQAGDTFHYQVNVAGSITPGAHTISVNATDNAGLSTMDSSQTLCVSEFNILLLVPEAESLYVRPGEAVVVDMDVANLAQMVNGCQALLGYSSTYLNAGTVAAGGGVWTELIYQSWAVADEIDTAIGVTLEGGPTGTDADGTVAVVTLTAGTTEGLTRLIFRPDGTGGYVTALSDLNAQPVWPIKRDSVDIVIDGTPPADFVVTADPLCAKNQTTLNFATTDNLSGVDYYELFVDSSSLGAVASPYTLDLSGYADGAYSVHVTAYDRAGNAKDSPAVSVGVDNTAPVIGAITAEQNGASVLCPAVAVQGTVDIYVEVTDGGCAGLVVPPAVTVDGIGSASYVDVSGDTYHYTVDVLASTANGAHAIRVNAEDTLGNSGADDSAEICVNKNQIRGRVELDSFTGAARTVRFVASGGSPASWELSLSFTGGIGSYTLVNVPDGTTALSAKTAWNLREKLTVSLDTQGQATGVDFIRDGVDGWSDATDHYLRGGDLNADNYVNIFDYSVLKINWNTHNAVADISGDGDVQLHDYSILKNSWFKAGDAE